MAETPGRPEPVERLVEELGKLPGVGRRTAERLADHLVRAGRDEAMALAVAIRDVKQSVRPCGQCGNFSDADPCAICADPRRERTLLCVVAAAKDLLAMERSGAYRGLYHVLGARAAPLDGQRAEDVPVDRLVERVKAEGIAEVILATDADADGDLTSHLLARALKEAGVRVSRLSRGIPAGSSVEFASPATLGEALEGRREV